MGAPEALVDGSPCGVRKDNAIIKQVTQHLLETSYHHVIILNKLRIQVYFLMSEGRDLILSKKATKKPDCPVGKQPDELCSWDSVR